MKEYDIIIAGGGLSGTMLLSMFLRSSCGKKKFLLIEENRKGRTPHHWSFWLKEKTFLDPILKKHWQEFSVTFLDFSRDLPLQNYRISLLESDAYYAFVESEFRKNKNVDMVDDKVIDVIEKEGRVHVYTRNTHYSAKYAFDSTYPHYEEKKKQHIYMAGLSTVVTTKKEQFDPSVMRFIDFRGSPNGDLFFFYLLPITATQAIIETAHVTKAPRNMDVVHRKLLQNYIENVLSLGQYAFIKERYAAIPLGRQRRPEFSGNSIFNIGAKAGLVDPLTTYGLVNIYKDCKLIVDSFEIGGAPKRRYKPDWKRTCINTPMLRVMEQNPLGVKQMYKELFLSCKNGDDILAYLNGELSFQRSLLLFKKVNPLPLLKHV